MKQIFRTNNRFILEEVPVPIPGTKEILVKVHYSLISTGTETSDLRMQNKSFIEILIEKKNIIDKVTNKLKSEGIPATWNAIYNKLKPSEKLILLSPIGYSNSGTIISKGNGVLNFNVNDRVACAGSGIAAHAEYVKVPINLAVKIPGSLDLNEAAFTTVASIAMQGIRRARINLGETIVIIGLGLLGQIAVQIAKASGLYVVGIDLDHDRLDLAKSLGADRCYLITEKNGEEKIKQEIFGVGADAVVIYAHTKSSKPINLALKICREKGRVVIVGSIGMNLERGEMYRKELDISMSTSYGPGRYDPNYEVDGNDYPIGYVRWTENRNMLECVNLLVNKKIQVNPLINRVFPIEKATEAYDYLVNDKKRPIAVLFSYSNTKKHSKNNKKVVLKKTPILGNKINIGILGGGQFASRIHIPNILNLNQYYNLIGISNNNTASSVLVGKKFKPYYITTDPMEILNDENIDSVIIATRHDLHAQLTVDSLRKRKHVLVEKPLALNREELEKVKTAQEESNCFLTIGYNRRYSELSLIAKEILNKKSGPCFINYRVNAGYIPTNSWVQNPSEGGGRIIGECCHFLDLLNYFVESEITLLKIANIKGDNEMVLSDDNISVTIEYKNGSIAQLSYVSIGSKTMNKERIEIFCNGTSIVIDNFKTMDLYEEKRKTINRKEIDKGLKNELIEFAKLIKGKKSNILAIEDAFLVTEETFIIQDAVRGLLI